MNLFYPQWQGSGPDLSPYRGALELKDYLAPRVLLEEVEVSTDPVSGKKNNIYGYDEILLQMKRAAKLIDHHKPQKIFTIGGGCDAGLLPVSYLNHLYPDELTVIWFDAHGDLNSPHSSPSGYFYGMPARALLGESDPAILELLPSTLYPAQLIMAGLRDLDPAEIEFIKDRGLKVLAVEELEPGSEKLTEAIKSSGQRSSGAGMHRKIYIHLDLDVLDPEAFPFVPVPTAGGIRPEILLNLLQDLSKNYSLVGLGIFEYSASGQKPNAFMKELLKIGIG